MKNEDSRVCRFFAARKCKMCGAMKMMMKDGDENVLKRFLGLLENERKKSLCTLDFDIPRETSFFFFFIIVFFTMPFSNYESANFKIILVNLMINFEH
jgi:hypothetical protein